jgi:ribosomal protein L7Ae-like RNA K-turn-binding protein
VETQVPGKTWVVDFSTKQVVYEVSDVNGKYSYYKVDYKIVKGKAVLGSAPEVVQRKTTWEALEVDEKMNISEFLELSTLDKQVKDYLVENENEITS